jgi:hypothetical protein
MLLPRTELYKEFKSISNAIDLIIEQSNKTEIIVQLMIIYKSITTTVENGVLIISCDYNSFINIESKKVTVKMPLLNPCALLVLHRLQVQIQLG